MLKLFNISSAFDIELAADKSPNAPGPTFKRQPTLSIITFLSLQNFFATTLVAGLASGLYYYFSLSANQKSADYRLEAIRNFTVLQQSGTYDNVEAQLGIFLSQPLLTVKSSADLFTAGFMDLEDWSQLQRWFFPQILAHSMVSSISYVEYPSGDAFGIDSNKVGNSVTYNLQLTNSKANRLCPAAVSTGGFCPITSGYKTTYIVTEEGVIDPSSALTTIASPMFGPPDPTELGRYAMENAAKNEVSWFPSIKVTDSEKGLVGLYFVHPLWTDNGTFLGTFAGQLSFTITHDMLSALQKDATENTVIYVFQRDEVMVGTSTGDSTIKYDAINGSASVTTLQEMTNPFIKLTQTYIRSQYGGDFESVSLNTSLSSKLQDPSTGIDYILQFSALNVGHNLDWLVVVGAPQTDYTAAMLSVQGTLLEQFNKNNRNVVIVIFAFQIGLILLAMAGFWIQIVSPLRSLVNGMIKAQEFDFTAIAEGKMASNPSHLAEVYQCEKAFFDMTTKFAKAFRSTRPSTQRQQSSSGSCSTGQLPRPSMDQKSGLSAMQLPRPSMDQKSGLSAMQLPRPSMDQKSGLSAMQLPRVSSGLSTGQLPRPSVDQKSGSSRQNL